MLQPTFAFKQLGPDVGAMDRGSFPSNGSAGTSEPGDTTNNEQ